MSVNVTYSFPPFKKVVYLIHNIWFSKKAEDILIFQLKIDYFFKWGFLVKEALRIYAADANKDIVRNYHF